MATLGALPEELLVQIIAAVDEQGGPPRLRGCDLYRLCLVSKAFSRLTVPFLYKKYTYYTCYKELRQFLGTLCQRPDLARYVQSLDLLHWDAAPLRRASSRAEKDNFLTGIDQIIHRTMSDWFVSHANQWRLAVEEDQPYVHVVLLVALTPNLWRLAIPCLDHGMIEWGPLLDPMQKLERVCVRVNLRAHGLGDVLIAPGYEGIPYVPSLKTLEYSCCRIRTLSPVFRTDTYLGLKALALDLVAMESDAFKQIMTRMQSLESFSGDEICYMADGRTTCCYYLVSHMSSRKHSLRHLKLIPHIGDRITPSLFDDRYYSLFTQLESLHITYQLLPSTEPTLRHSISSSGLPPSLKSLTVRLPRKVPLRQLLEGTVLAVKHDGLLPNVQTLTIEGGNFPTSNTNAMLNPSGVTGAVFAPGSKPDLCLDLKEEFRKLGVRLEISPQYFC